MHWESDVLGTRATGGVTVTCFAIMSGTRLLGCAGWAGWHFVASQFQIRRRENLPRNDGSVGAQRLRGPPWSEARRGAKLYFSGYYLLEVGCELVGETESAWHAVKSEVTAAMVPVLSDGESEVSLPSYASEQKTRHR